MKDEYITMEHLFSDSLKASGRISDMLPGWMMSTQLRSDELLAYPASEGKVCSIKR